MRKFLYLICYLFIFTNMARADVLPQDSSTQLNTDVLDNESLVEEEIIKLRKEVETLNTQLKQKEQAEEDLKQELTQYQTQEQLQKDYQTQLTQLQQTLQKEPFLTKDIQDADYNLAYQSIALGNIKYAEEHLRLFINKDFKSVSLEGFNAVPTTPTATQQNTSSPNTNDKTESNNTEATKKQAEQKKEYLIAVQNLKNKAYYILGVINLINLEPQEAINNLSQAYKGSNKANLVLLTLVKIVKAFDMLEKKDEVCLSVKNFNDTLSQVQDADSEFSFPPEYIKSVKDSAVKYDCS